jgi:rhamnulokinase
MKNITGLWLIQEARRQWAREGLRLSWDEITELAKSAPSLRSIIEVDDDAFRLPGDIPSRMRTQCERTGQPVPQDRAAIARTVFEAIALKYRRVLEMAEQLTGKRTDALNIVGGGTQNRLLSQFAANAIGRPVIAGPIEATAAGNILMQMIAVGAVKSLAEGREVIRRSFPVETFEPQNVAEWDEAYGRYRTLTA